MYNLVKKISKSDSWDDTVTLEYRERTKSRLRVTLNSGNESGILLPRGTNLHHGDILQSENGFTVLVEAAKEMVSTAKTDDPHLLARVCYHLGNRHVPLQIESTQLRYLHDHVLDEMLESMGLIVIVENTYFEPESGAYNHNNVDNHKHNHAN